MGWQKGNKPPEPGLYIVHCRMMGPPHCDLREYYTASQVFKVDEYTWSECGEVLGYFRVEYPDWRTSNQASREIAQ